jgi:predicted DNA-binding transcriptional regulator YafY
MNPTENEEQIVTITYLNHRGKISERQIIPYEFGWGSTEYYPTPQFLLEAWDFNKKALRTFSMNNIINWRGNHATETQESLKRAGTLARAMCSLLPEGYIVSRIDPSAGRTTPEGNQL